MSDIISVKDLVEVYSDGTKAVDNISFSVKEGEFFGFLGPNGAGKAVARYMLLSDVKIIFVLSSTISGIISF